MIKRLESKTITSTKIYKILLKRTILKTYAISILLFTIYLLFTFYTNEKIISFNIEVHDEVIKNDLKESNMKLIGNFKNQVLLNLENLKILVGSVTTVAESGAVEGYEEDEYDEISECGGGSSICFFKEGVSLFSQLSLEEREKVKEVSKRFKLFGVFAENSKISGFSAFLNSGEISLFKSIKSEFKLDHRLKESINLCKSNPEICSLYCEKDKQKNRCTEFSFTNANFEYNEFYFSHPIFETGLFLDKKLIKICQVIGEDGSNDQFCVYGDISIPISKEINKGKFTNLSVVIGSKQGMVSNIKDGFVIANFMKINEEVFEYDYGGMNYNQDYGYKFTDGLSFSNSDSLDKIKVTSVASGDDPSLYVSHGSFPIEFTSPQLHLVVVTRTLDEDFKFSLKWILSSFYSSNYVQNMFIILWMSLNLIICHIFIENVISRLFHSLADVSQFVDLGDDVLNVKNTKQNLNYKEVNLLIDQILYYFLLIKFIRMLKSGKWTVKEFERIYLFFEDKDNYEAKAFLSGYLMNHYDKEGGARDFERAIGYGLRLYKYNEDKLGRYLKSSNTSEYEIKRLNFNIFKLLNSILRLKMKLKVKKSDGQETYKVDECLLVHDKIMVYYNNLDLNDTIRLHLILKRITLLLNKTGNKLDEVKKLMADAEILVSALLKNKRILVYIKNQYNLLTHLKQKCLRLRACIHLEDKDYKGGLSQLRKSFDYGIVYRKKHRIKILKKMKSVLSNLNQQGLVPYIDKLIHFNTGQKKEVLMLMECTYQSLAQVSSLKFLFVDIVQRVLKSHDTIQFECFNDSLHVVRGQTKLSELQKAPKDAIEQTVHKIRLKANSNYRNYYKCIYSGLKKFTEQEPLEFPKEENKKKSGDSSPNKYVVLGIFGPYNPRKFKTKLKRNRASGDQKSMDRKSSHVSIDHIDQNRSRVNSIDYLQTLLQQSFINLCLICDDIESIKKEKLYNIIAMSKRSLIIDLKEYTGERNKLNDLMKQFLDN